jgi:hypothetical protein
MHFRVLLEHCEDSTLTIIRQKVFLVDWGRRSSAAISQLFLREAEGYSSRYEAKNQKFESRIR